MPTLVFQGPKYWSERDEDAFFTWLNAIPSVVGVGGYLRDVHVQLKRRRLSQRDIREFEALFRRYRINRAALDRFLRGG